MTENTGGPAFPGQMPTGFDPRSGDFNEGMSLRDWFAGMALQGLCLGCCAHYTKGPCNSAIVERSYILADAMLAEREKSDA